MKEKINASQNVACVKLSPMVEFEEDPCDISPCSHKIM